jgi:predicted RNase H-like nuclease (RuvC/YqgF family)
VTTAAPDKAALVRARKHKRVEANELKAICEKRGFPTSNKLSVVTQAELQDDFALMGVGSSRTKLDRSFEIFKELGC